MKQDGTKNWTTISDRKEMEYHLIENNKIHFAQAERKIPTIEPLTSIPCNGTNQTCNNILERNYKIPTHLPHLVKRYLTNIKIDNNITQNETQ